MKSHHLVSNLLAIEQTIAKSFDLNVMIEIMILVVLFAGLFVASLVKIAS